jgi:hypothetical protein
MADGRAAGQGCRGHEMARMVVLRECDTGWLDGWIGTALSALWWLEWRLYEVGRYPLTEA